MTDKPRRYVRVQRNPDVVCAWEAACEFCGLLGHDYVPDRLAQQVADPHSRTCPAVAAATERDRLAAELATERADNSRLRADRAAWRTRAIRLQAELIEAREERAC